MSIGDFFRKLFTGPTRIGDGSAEDAATLHEELGTPGEGDAELKRMEGTGSGGDSTGFHTGAGGGATGLRYGASESAEAAEEDLASEEAPPDPDP
jgi:hypothetical protein